MASELMRECIYVAHSACGGGIDLRRSRRSAFDHVDLCIRGVAGGGFRTNSRRHCDVNLPDGLTLLPVVGRFAPKPLATRESMARV